MADFRRAGFTVTWGGDPATAYNAFVYFPRGGFIELFDLPIHGLKRLAAGAAVAVGAWAGNATMQRYHRWNRSHGLCDVALETVSPLPAALAGAASRGLAFTPIRNMQRQQSDAGTLAS